MNLPKWWNFFWQLSLKSSRAEKSIGSWQTKHEKYLRKGKMMPIMDSRRQKKRGAMDKTILLEIFWKVLEPQGISKSAYHGGDMEGNQIRKFANLSYKVWPEICSLLKDVPVNKRAHNKCTDDLNENV
jgi:hypothetical protein